MNRVQKDQQADAVLERGNRFLSEGDFHKAVQVYHHALRLNHQLVEAHYNCGVAYHKLAIMQEAAACYRAAIELSPDFAEAHYNLAHAYMDLHQVENALAHYKIAFKLQSGNAATAYSLGNAYKALGQPAAACDAYRQALQLRSNYAEALNNLGVILRDEEQLEQALELFNKARGIKPDLVEVYYNIGVTLQKQGEYEQGRQFYKKALDLKPGYAPARWLYFLSLPMLYDSADEIADLRHRFVQSLKELISTTPLTTPQQQREALEGVASTTNFYLQYQGLDDRLLQKQYGEFAAGIMALNFPQWTTSRQTPSSGPSEKIRIGYVSSLMYSHTIGIFLEGWLARSDRTAFDIHCYHVGHKKDALTVRITCLAHHFHHIPGSVAAVADQIARDHLHILVHTDIGMNPTTQQLAALRLAPVQCKGWGHPVTTGLPTIDYYLSSNLMEPLDAKDHYTEQLVRLPDLALCYTPPELPDKPKTRAQLGLPENRIIFLSTQSLFKYLPQYDVVYATIARQVKSCCFVFISHQSPAVTNRFKKRLARAFDRVGLDAGTSCHFMSRMNHHDFLSLNLAADILLDTPDWSGGKTTLEAIACGLPVVTLPGKMMRGRHAYAFLKVMGIDATIAVDVEDYCCIAVKLAVDGGFFREVKSKIKDHRHRLYASDTFMQALEKFYTNLAKNPLEDKIDGPAKSHLSNIEVIPAKAGIQSFHTVLDSRLRGNDYSPAFYECVKVAPLENEAEDEQSQATDHYNRGVRFHEKKLFPQAIAEYEKAIRFVPDRPEVLHNLAQAKQACGQIDEAEKIYNKVLSLTPQDEKTIYNLGTLYLDQQRFDPARQLFSRVIAINPDSAKAHNNLGKVYQAGNDFQSALICYQTACRVNPDLVQAWFNQGEIFQQLDRLEEAVTCYKKALIINPTMSEAVNNLGNAYQKGKQYEKAADCYRQVISLQPDLPEGHYNLGSVLRITESYKDAIIHLTQAVKLRPDYADAWNNLALTCKNIGDFDRALTCFNRTLELAPDLSLAHWNRSFVYFLKGDYSRGWKDFEWRFKTPLWKTLYPFRLKGKRWEGRTDLQATVFVHDEQGLGDTFQFVRFLPLLKQRCKKIILETRKELISLLSCIRAVDHIVERPKNGPTQIQYDYHIPLMSLPGIFQISDSPLPAVVPYITADKKKSAHWEQKLLQGVLKVGLVWAGRPEHTNDTNRSCRLNDLRPIFENKQIAFVSLQKGTAADQLSAYPDLNHVFEMGSLLEDFSDTAAVISRLDLVITVDTAVAHLAGAMGIPVWVMIPFIPDWRWGISGVDSSWYPTMRLFRQTTPKQWHGVVRDICEALERLVNDASTSFCNELKTCSHHTVYKGTL